MGFTLNWDLSGRFFPYAGQFLPPVQPGETWLNDGEGSQKRANTSFESIDAYYAQMQAEGWAGLSYFNVFEYGENICGTGVAGLPPPCNFSGVPSGNAPSSSEPWANSSWYLLQHFPASVITDFACGQSQWCEATPAAKRPLGSRMALGTWCVAMCLLASELQPFRLISLGLGRRQGGIVVDPAEKQYQAHLLAQLKRKYDRIPHFQGMVIDRADWNALCNFDSDDGASFVDNRTCRSLRYSYLETVGALRAMMAQRQPSMEVNETVMLTNNQGWAQLALMEHFDGSFSEGGALNSHGLLGMRSTAILWT